MRDAILHSVSEALLAIQTLSQESSLIFMEEAAKSLARCFTRENKVLIAGNGGSLCDAGHFAEELSGQFRGKRRALSAIALSDPGHLSCVGNDMGFEQVFARGVEAHGKLGDLFIVLTTSGNSCNLVEAMKVAKARGLETIAFLGKTGGLLKGAADLEWIVSGFPYSDRVQEAHMAAIHIIIEMTESLLFGNVDALVSK